jgi:hypothetical protein
MIDLIQIQDDVFGLLMSAPQLATVNIVEERKFILEQAVEWDALWQTNRNGKSGCGILVEQPDVISDSPNVTGPPQSVQLSFVCVQNGDAAFTELGSGLFAEEVEQFVIDALHLQAIGGLGVLQIKGQFSSPAQDYPGINARRMKVSMTPFNSAQSQRTAPILAVIAAGQCTLTCSTAAAQIYFTLDGSFPSNAAVAVDPLSVTAVPSNPAPINKNSTLYAGPFPVQSGQVLRAAAYAPPMNPGQILYQPIP